MAVEVESDVSSLLFQLYMEDSDLKTTYEQKRKEREEEKRLRRRWAKTKEREAAQRQMNETMKQKQTTTTKRKRPTTENESKDQGETKKPKNAYERQVLQQLDMLSNIQLSRPEGHLVIYNLASKYVTMYMECVWPYNYFDPCIFDTRYLFNYLCTSSGSEEKSPLSLNLCLMVATGAMKCRDRKTAYEFYHRARIILEDIFDVTDVGVADALLKLGSFADGELLIRDRSYYLKLALCMCESLKLQNTILYHNTVYFIGMKSLLFGRDPNEMIRQEVQKTPIYSDFHVVDHDISLPLTREALGTVKVAIRILWRVIYAVSACTKNKPKGRAPNATNMKRLEQIIARLDSRGNVSPHGSPPSSPGDLSSPTASYEATFAPAPVPFEEASQGGLVEGDCNPEQINQLLHSLYKLKDFLCVAQEPGSATALPNHISLDMSMANIGLIAKLHFMLGHWEKAIQFATQFVTMSRRESFTYIHRGVLGIAMWVFGILFKTQRLDEVAILLERLQQIGAQWKMLHFIIKTNADALELARKKRQLSVSLENSTSAPSSPSSCDDSFRFIPPRDARSFDKFPAHGDILTADQLIASFFSTGS